MDPYGWPAELLAETCRVSIRTARNWKRQGRIPAMPARLAELVAEGQLGAIWPSWAGFVMRREELWTPYGFSVRPGEVSSIEYRNALIRALQRELETPLQGVLFR